MKSHAIQISLDLGERQHLWTAVQNAFAELLREEPEARHAAMLMLTRMSQEAERLFQVVHNPQLPLGLVAAVTARIPLADFQRQILDNATEPADIVRASANLVEAAPVPVNIVKPAGCAAKLIDGQVVCDLCLKFYEPGTFVCEKTQA